MHPFPSHGALHEAPRLAGILWDDSGSFDRASAPVIPAMKSLVVKALCVLSMALAAPAWADIGRDEAAAAAQRVARGRVLSVDRTEADHRPLWRVKILTAQGEVRVILIDAASGRVVG
jgi:hypothetical protein